MIRNVSLRITTLTPEEMEEIVEFEVYQDVCQWWNEAVKDHPLHCPCEPCRLCPFLVIVRICESFTRLSRAWLAMFFIDDLMFLKREIIRLTDDEALLLMESHTCASDDGQSQRPSATTSA